MSLIAVFTGAMTLRPVYGRTSTVACVWYVQETIKKIGEVSSDPDTAEPQYTVRLVDCGLNTLAKKYDLTTSQLDSVADINS